MQGVGRGGTVEVQKQRPLAEVYTLLPLLPFATNILIWGIMWFKTFPCFPLHHLHVRCVRSKLSASLSSLALTACPGTPCAPTPHIGASQCHCRLDRLSPADPGFCPCGACHWQAESGVIRICSRRLDGCRRGRTDRCRSYHATGSGAAAGSRRQH